MSFSSKIKLIEYFINEVDNLISAQVNEILHHSLFQKVEASWRSLLYLCQNFNAQNKNLIHIKILDVKKEEIKHDLINAFEFDQSELFTKLYSKEFDTPGGQPYGLVVGDYFFDNSYDDIVTLQEISKISALGFSPFISSISENFFDLKDFANLADSNLIDYFLQTRYNYWHKLCKNENGKFIALMLPKVLRRNKYDTYYCEKAKFYFTEKISKFSDNLFANGAYEFADLIIKKFIDDGWFVDLIHNKNKIDNYTLRESFLKNDFENFKKYKTEILFTQSQAYKLAQLGFIVLLEAKYTEETFFANCNSIFSNNDTKNIKLGASLNYLLCVCRFAHFIKIILRDKIGKFISSEELEKDLENWIGQYVASDDTAIDASTDKFPLRSVNLKIFDNPKKNGAYYMLLDISPRTQIKEIESSLNVMIEF